MDLGRSPLSDYLESIDALVQHMRGGGKVSTLAGAPAATGALMRELEQRLLSDLDVTAPRSDAPDELATTPLTDEAIQRKVAEMREQDPDWFLTPSPEQDLLSEIERHVRANREGP